MSGALDDPRISRGMRAQRELRQKRLADGARQIGWKVGFGAPAAKEKLRIDMPLVGFLLDRAVVPSGGTVSIKGWQKPAAEAEIAVYIGHDVPGNADRQTVRSAIAAIGPAIELADLDCPLDDCEAILSGDIFQRHIVLGPKDPGCAGARLDGLSGCLLRNGQPLAVPADLESGTGEIVGIVRHVAELTAQLGDGLRAGQFIICGSVTPPLFLEPADKSIEWTLDPVGAVSVSLTS